MTLEEAQRSTGKLVRIRRGFGFSKNRNRGRILGVEGQMVLVLPFGNHRQPEPMPPENLNLWKGGNHRIERERKSGK